MSESIVVKAVEDEEPPKQPVRELHILIFADNEPPQVTLVGDWRGKHIAAVPRLTEIAYSRYKQQIRKEQNNERTV